MIESIKTTTVDKIDTTRLFIISKDMEEYSGWGWVEHVHWVAELTGLSAVDLILLVGKGYLILTNEEVSVVWLVSNDYYKSTARLLYED